MTFPAASAATRAIRDGVPHEPRIFSPARGRRALRVAGFGDHLSAAAIDVLVYVVACPFVLTLFALLLRGMWPIGALAAAQAYLALSWAEGRSPGMAVTGTRLVDSRNGCPPGLAGGLLRASMLVPLGAAVFLLADASLPQPQASFSSHPLVLLGSIATLTLGAISYLWCLWDPSGRTLHDRLAGVVAVRDERTPRRAGRLAQRER